MFSTVLELPAGLVEYKMNSNCVVNMTEVQYRESSVKCRVWYCQSLEFVWVRWSRYLQSVLLVTRGKLF